MCLACTLRRRKNEELRKAAESSSNHEDNADGSMNSTKVWNLLHYSHLPQWMQDNEYIHAHYRPQMSSALDCIRSGLFHLHNETVNIWSHVLGALLFIGLIIFVYTHFSKESGWFGHVFEHMMSLEEELVTYASQVGSAGQALITTSTAAQYTEDKLLYGLSNVRDFVSHISDDLPWKPVHGVSVLSHWVSSATQRFPDVRVMPFLKLEQLPPGVSKQAMIAEYRDLLLEHRTAMLPMLIGAIFCTVASAFYHAIWNHSPRLMRIFSRLDYLGIILLTLGHSLMASYYLFFCKPSLANVYSKILIASAVPTVLCFFHPKFEFPEFRTIRAVIFIGFGVTGMIPLVHAGVLHKFSQDLYLHHLLFLGSSGLLYLLGGIIFATRVPEVWLPGRFDLFLNSHQWLHVLVVMAALVHFYGCMLEAEWRFLVGCSMSPLVAT